MTKFLNRLTIYQKLQLGFGLLVLLTLFVVGLNYFSGVQATSDIEQSANVLVPTALASANARATLLRMLADIRGYLVLGKAEFRQNYEANKQQFVSQLTEMEQLAADSTHSDNQQHLMELRQKFTTWSALPEQMFKLHDDPILNQPAFRILAEEGEGPLTVIFPQLNELIWLQGKREATLENQTLLRDMADFQGSFASLVSNVRYYLITLNGLQKLQYQADLATNQSAWERLVKQRGNLTTKQQDMLDRIGQARDGFLPLPERMFAAIEGEHSHEDLFLLSTQAEPLAEEMLNSLDELVVSQQTALQTNLSNGVGLLAATRLQVLVGGVIALILGGGMAYVFQENIGGPIRRLTNTAEQIAQGDLTALAIVESSDEIGTLATQFNEMTNRLRQTLQETKGLFQAAQAILGSTDLDDIGRNLIRNFNSLVEADSMILYLVDHEKRQVTTSVEHRPTMEVPMNLDYEELQHGITGMVFASKQPILSPHAYDGIEPETTRARRAEAGVGALIVVPFVTKGKVIGTITAANRINQRVFTPHDVELLMALTTQAATAIENVRLYEETRQAKEEAEQARARAEVANQAKSDFLSRMSHELRTPLNGILGYAQILKNDAELSRKQADGLSVIQQSGEHLLTLITDILDLAKIEAGRFELLPTPIQLDNFMKSTLAIIQMRAEKKRLEVSYEPLGMIPDAVAVDEKRLRQVLLNLLNNAIKFTETGQVTLQLEQIDMSEVNQVRLCFAVVDTGIGMTPEQLQQIFNPFEQVGDMKKRAEGTGLGLAISKQLVEAMGGQLQVKSEFNQGSTFWFELPLPLANMTLTQTPLNRERIVGYEGEPRKILVVDDKVNNRMVFLNILEPLGFEIRMAEDGQEAIDQAQSWQPDLILMDMIMPNVTGFEATQTIRSISDLRTIAIIGTSASAFEKEAERVKLVGCDAFISKPVHVEELVLLIGELLHLQWRYQEAAAATVSFLDSRQAEMVCPPLELLQHWQILARQGDLLTIEDEADALLKDNPHYAPFVEKIQDYVISMDISELIRFLAEQS